MTLNFDDLINSGFNALSTTTGSLGLDGVYYLKAELIKSSKLKVVQSNSELATAD